eukprot:CFRG2160T1
MLFAIGLVAGAIIVLYVELKFILRWKRAFFLRENIGRISSDPDFLSSTRFNFEWDPNFFSRRLLELLPVPFKRRVEDLVKWRSMMTSEHPHGAMTNRVPPDIIPGQIDTTRWYQKLTEHAFKVVYKSNPENVLKLLLQEIDVAGKVIASQYARDFELLSVDAGEQPILVKSMQVMADAIKGSDTVSLIHVAHGGGAVIKAKLTTWAGKELYYNIGVHEVTGCVLCRMPANLDEFYSMGFIEDPQYKFSVAFSEDNITFSKDTTGLGKIIQNVMREAIRCNDVLPKEFKFSYQFMDNNYIHKTIATDGTRCTVFPVYENCSLAHDFVNFIPKKDTSAVLRKTYCEKCVETISSKNVAMQCQTCFIIIHKKCTSIEGIHNCISLESSLVDEESVKKKSKSSISYLDPVSHPSGVGKRINSRGSTRSGSAQSPSVILQVKIIRAENCIPKDKNGLSDPFCVVSLGPEQYRTKKIQNTINPVWKESIFFELELADVHLLRVNVFDWNFVGKSQFMGFVCLNLQSLRPDLKEEGTYSLNSWGWNETVSGSITMSFNLSTMKTEDYEQRTDLRTQFPATNTYTERNHVLPPPLARNIYQFYNMHNEFVHRQVRFLLSIVRLREGFFRGIVERILPEAKLREMEEPLDNIVKITMDSIRDMLTTVHNSHRSLHEGNINETVGQLEELILMLEEIPEWMRVATDYLEKVQEYSQELQYIATTDLADDVDALPLAMLDMSADYIKCIKASVVTIPECFCTRKLFEGLAEDSFDLWDALRSPYHRAMEYESELLAVLSIARKQERKERLRIVRDSVVMLVRSSIYHECLRTMSSTAVHWMPKVLLTMEFGLGSDGELRPLVMFGDLQWYPDKRAVPRRVTLWLWDGLLLLTGRKRQSQGQPRLCAEPIWLLDVVVELPDSSIQVPEDASGKSLVTIVNASGKVWLLGAYSEMQAVIWKTNILQCCSSSPKLNNQSSDDWINILKKFPRMVKLRRWEGNNSLMGHNINKSMDNTEQTTPKLGRSKSALPAPTCFDAEGMKAKSKPSVSETTEVCIEESSDAQKPISTTILRKKCDSINMKREGILVVTVEGGIMFQTKSRFGITKEKLKVDPENLCSVDITETGVLSIGVSDGMTYSFDHLLAEDRDAVSDMLAQSLKMRRGLYWK